MSRRSLLVLAFIALLVLGRNALSLWQFIAAPRPRDAAAEAVNAALRITKHQPGLPADTAVTVDPTSTATPTLVTDPWGPRFKRDAWSYRPWRGIRLEAFVIAVCSRGGDYRSTVTQSAPYWTVRFSPAEPGDCSRRGV